MADDPIAELDVDMLRQNLATLDHLGTACGEWSDSVQARPTGYSLHIRFEKQVSVETALSHSQVMQRCPAMLADALRRMIAIAETKRNE